MRTTLDEGLAQKARALAAKRCLPGKVLANQALRSGLALIERQSKPRPYRTKPHSMGLRRGTDLDNIQELLSKTDGKDSR
jgi:hypothetical protein